MALAHERSRRLSRLFHFCPPYVSDPQSRFPESGNCTMHSGFQGAPQPLFAVTPRVYTLSSTPTLPLHLLSYPCMQRHLTVNLSNNRGVPLLRTGVQCAQWDSVKDPVSILGLKTKLPFLTVTPEKSSAVLCSAHTSGTSSNCVYLLGSCQALQKR